jgi:hypothetical protein
VTKRTTIEQQITAFTLAIEDLQQVATAARLIAEHDADLWFARRIGEVGLTASIAEYEARNRPTALGDFQLRLLIETGLIVTYARPFTKGKGHPFPLRRGYVPSDAQALHDTLLDLRNRVHAHADASGPDQFRREVHYEQRGQGGERSEVSGAGLLDQATLKRVAHLAERIITKPEADRRHTYQLLARL